MQKTMALFALDAPTTRILQAEYDRLRLDLDPKNWKLIEDWPRKVEQYKGPIFKFKVRDKELGIQTHSESLSHLQIPKIALPRYEAWGDLLQWNLQENVPGEFPYTAGIYPFKREGEDPTRMFAGEGGPERTNRRFHYVSLTMPAKRLSTAFDSVTLYGNDPDFRPDIYGKIGNSGVSICCLDDAKKLYSGFNLCDPKTSVSMTINGPAPMLLGYFMNAAIDQQCELYIKKNGLEADVKNKINTLYSSLSSGEGRGEVQIKVKDNGNGIPQKILDKIFQPFFTTKPTGQGTGLGLSLSYDIVKAHGGELKVVTKHIEGLPADLSVQNGVKAEASAQAGSEFIVHLPIA
jgi:methylmalonyl-CoA mutase